MNSKRSERLNSKLLKDREKRFEKQSKFLKISKDASQEEYDNAILNYAISLGYDVYKVLLTQEQTDNEDFMLTLFQQNPYALDLKSPGPQLLKDCDFMVKFFRVKYDDFCKRLVDPKLKKLYYAILPGYEIVENAQFLEKLAKEFPEENILRFADKYIDELFVRNRGKKEQIVSELSQEFMEEHARKFGEQALRYLPDSYPERLKLIALGIECDGFDSLTFLKVGEILDNVDLIVKAIDKDGVEKYRDYFNNDLDCMRVHRYMCHGEEHCDITQDYRYKQVQESLRFDKRVLEALDRNTPVEDAKYDMTTEKTGCKTTERKKN